jgi:hypothetical protein
VPSKASASQTGTSKRGKQATEPVSAWRLLDQVKIAEQEVISAKQGAAHDLKVRQAAQAHDELVETLDELDLLRIACDELGGPSVLETFPAMPPPPPVKDDALAWWDSTEMHDWERQFGRAANKLEDITKVGWTAMLASLMPTMPAEQVLANLEAASPELRKACSQIRKLIAAWGDLARKKIPEKGDAAAAQATARAIEESWQALEDAGGAPERLELLTSLSAQPPTITLADLTEEDWAWLIETELANSVYLSIWED